MLTLLKTFAVIGAYASIAQADGCGKTHKTGFTDNIAFKTTQNVDRTYGIYVPLNYNDKPQSAKHLIFDFHGHGGDAHGQYQNSKYYNNTQGANYVVVYPNGLPSRNSDEQAWQGAPYAAVGVDDLGFVKDLLANITSQYCIDSNHVYASGKSNGGGFTDTLACSDVGDSFAAFAMASAALYTDTSENSCSKHRVIMESHGDKDQTIYPQGGCYGGKDPCPKGSSYPNITEWVGWWAQRDGATANKPDTSNSNYKYTSYSASKLPSVVSHYEIYNLGHCWPTVSSNTDSAKSECKVYVLDYTQKVVDLFGKWSQSNAPKN